MEAVLKKNRAALKIGVIGCAGGMGQMLKQGFDRLEAVLKEREWLAASRFTIADIMMSDVLRMPNDLGELESYGALKAYVAPACSRPAFQKAQRDQLVHFETADAAKNQA